MATKREKQLAALLIKERLERLTGKKVILKENEDKKFVRLKKFERKNFVNAHKKILVHQ